MSAANSTKFWVVCCEENEVTQAIARTVDSWRLTGVRSLIGDRQTLLSNVDIIADASYVIFVTPDERPGSQAKVHPLNMSQFAGVDATAVGEFAVNEESSVDMMTSALYHHGRTPQAWLLQLPTTEIRVRYAQPVSTQKSVAQAIAAIEVFVRNYTRSTPFSIPVQPQSVPASPKPASPKPASQKREVVLTHYRRI